MVISFHSELYHYKRVLLLELVKCEKQLSKWLSRLYRQKEYWWWNGWHCWDKQRGCCFPGLALAPLSSHLAMTSLIRDLHSYLPASMIDSQYIEEGNINMFLFPGSPLVVSHGFTEHWPRWPLPFPNLLRVWVSKSPLQPQACALVFRDPFRDLSSVRFWWSQGDQAGDRAFL